MLLPYFVRQTNSLPSNPVFGKRPYKPMPCQQHQPCSQMLIHWKHLHWPKPFSFTVGIKKNTTLALFPSSAAPAGYGHPKSVQSLLEQYCSDPLNQQQRAMVIESTSLGRLSTVSVTWVLSQSQLPQWIFQSADGCLCPPQEGISKYPWFLVCGIGLDPSVRHRKIRHFPCQNFLFLSCFYGSTSVLRLNICR